LKNREKERVNPIHPPSKGAIGFLSSSLSEGIGYARVYSIYPSIAEKVEG